jgi:NTP pyrophosphatase (non-canonical NTP hydrolase)
MDFTAINDFYESMEEFYSRFDLLPPTCLAVGLKLKEEVDEFIVAMHGGNPDEIMEEGGDVIAVVLGGFIACGLDVNHVIAGMYRVIAKNGAKTLETHERKNGTISKLMEDES